jgi:hypothetical protein
VFHGHTGAFFDLELSSRCSSKNGRDAMAAEMNWAMKRLALNVNASLFFKRD